MLSRKIEFVKGVGESRAKLLKEELGVRTVADLLDLYPFRYDDRSQFQTIDEVRPGDTVQLRGKLVNLTKHKMRRGQRLNGLFKDKTGIIDLTWFQGVKWITDKLVEGREYTLYGKVSNFKGKKTIAHPEMEPLDKQSTQFEFLPVYASTEKLNSRWLGVRTRRNILQNIFSQAKSADFPETLTQELMGSLKLCSRFQAYKWIHFPSNSEQIKAASNRFKFEELFFMQLRILQIKLLRERKLLGLKFESVGTYVNRFYKEKLPFELTNAQKRVIKEIRADLGGGIQMNRLLQGDVGSGKTMVAIMAMLIALDNGYQSCLLAPTEILAQQHYKGITDYLHGLGIRVAFLSGSVKGQRRQELLRFLKRGQIDILVGTHAILEDPVEFAKLGLAVTDEQHRFGVKQRSKLWTKNEHIPPHILVMTATPIPRTLAMTTYGDLDVSILDELPPGRKPVKTVHRKEVHRMQVFEFMRTEIAKGRQVYVVYPLIDESEVLDLQNLQEGYDQLLSQFPAPEHQLSVVHGRMKARDKELEMQRFVKGKSQIMVATTVIEVGVNVPNASIMIIENAERFGLSQLHQLRGRVGRGADQSFCILMTKSNLNPTALKRIQTMCETNDGFKIAEADMELRGPGEIEGTQQSGVLNLRIANLSTDSHILRSARHLAFKILQEDPELTQAPNDPIRNALADYKKKHQSWGRIS